MSQNTFVRDRFTWLTYFSLAYYSYLLSTLGPLMPFLRKELDLSYTVGSFHFSAFALGMISAGLTSDTLTQRLGRDKVYWGGGTLMGLAIVLFILSPSVLFTIPSIYLIAFSGASLIVAIQAVLSDYHGNNRAIALTEVNVAASIAATFAPLLIGATQQTGLGWRSALLIAVIYWAILLYFRQPIPNAASSTDPNPSTKSTHLPSIFWVYCGVIFLVVSVEWSVVFWGADFLETEVGLKRVHAATLMSVFFIANVIGRTIGSRLTRRFPIGTLLLGAVILSIAGFLLYWLSGGQLLSILGLFITGLGIANLFPLTLAIASSSVGITQSDAASARISLSSGSAVLIMPQVLGILADKTNLNTAHAMILILLFFALMVVLYANRLARHLATP